MLNFDKIGCISEEKIKKICFYFVILSICTIFAPKSAPCVLSVRHLCRALLDIIEALCSFLQAENVGNFQSLRKSFENARVPNGHTQIHKDGHSGFTHLRGTAFIETILCISGISYDPQLEDVDIQFHASRVYIIMYAFVGDWRRCTMVNYEKVVIRFYAFECAVATQSQNHL